MIGQKKQLAAFSCPITYAKAAHVDLTTVFYVLTTTNVRKHALCKRNVAVHMA